MNTQAAGATVGLLPRRIATSLTLSLSAHNSLKHTSNHGQQRCREGYRRLSINLHHVAFVNPCSLCRIAEVNVAEFLFTWFNLHERGCQFLIYMLSAQCLFLRGAVAVV